MIDLKWMLTATKLLPVIVSAVHTVETISSGAHGQAKQDAAVDVVRTSLDANGTGAGTDLLTDPEVDRIVRDVIDAIVALRNVIAKRQAADGAGV